MTQSPYGPHQSMIPHQSFDPSQSFGPHQVDGGQHGGYQYGPPPRRGKGALVTLTVIGVILVIAIAITSIFVFKKDDNDSGSSASGKRDDKPTVVSSGEGPFEFGQIVEYPDGLKVTLGKPEKFTMKDGYTHSAGNTPYRFKVTVENATDATVELYCYPFDTTIDGSYASASFDSSLDYSVDDKVAVGKKTTGYFGYDVEPGSEKIVIELKVDYEHDNLVFQGDLPQKS